MSKSPDAFRTISEVALDLDLPQHVLRFWETRFNQIKPMKRGGGRRYYRPDDVALLRGIQHLLYNEGYTIKGVQRLLKDHGNKYAIAAGRGESLEGFVAVQSENKSDGPAKTAVSVSQAMDTAAGKANSSPKSKGLLKRLVGKEVQSEPQQSNLNITGDERQLLQATLYDLLECKRLLDQAR